MTRTAAALALVCATFWGCAALFSIEDRPLVRDASHDAQDGVAEAEAADRADSEGCVVGPRYCESFCPRPDFCDDFDDAQSLTALWNGGNIVASGSLEVDSDPDGGARGTALFARVAADLGDGATPASELGAAAALLHSLGTSPRGIRTKMRVRLVDLGFDNVFFDAAPLPGPGATIFSLFDRSGQGLGLTAWRHPSGLKVGVVHRTVVGGTSGSRPVLDFAVDPLAVETFRATYGNFEMVVGPAALLASLGLVCPRVDAGAPLAVYASLLLAECEEITGLSELPPWWINPSISVGALLTGTGRVTIAIDGVAVYLLR